MHDFIAAETQSLHQSVGARLEAFERGFAHFVDDRFALFLGYAKLGVLQGGIVLRLGNQLVDGGEIGAFHADLGTFLPADLGLFAVFILVKRVGAAALQLALEHFVGADVAGELVVFLHKGAVDFGAVAAFLVDFEADDHGVLLHFGAGALGKFDDVVVERLGHGGRGGGGGGQGGQQQGFFRHGGTFKWVVTALNLA